MGSLGGGMGRLFWWNALSRRAPRRSNPDQQRRSKSSESASATSSSSAYRFPINQAVTAGCLALTGDTIAQVNQRWRKRESGNDDKRYWYPTFVQDASQTLLSDHDWLRSLRMLSYGFLLYGPGSYAWYQLLDRVLPQQTAKNLLLKVFLNQVVLGPSVIAVIFAWNNLWLGKLKELPKKYQNDALPTLLLGLRFWIPVSILNFWVVPLQARVAFMSTGSVFWNFCLSSTMSNFNGVKGTRHNMATPAIKNIFRDWTILKNESKILIPVGRRRLLKVVMSSHTSNLRQHISRRRPYLQGRRLHSAQLPDGVLPATLQPHVFHAPSDLNESWRLPFEEAMLLVPSVGTRFQLQPLLPSSRPVPAIGQSYTREEESKLSEEEQKQSLQKLRRETYKPKYMYTQTARMVSRVGQYYQGRPITSDYEHDRSSNGDKCAICLEEFEAQEEVTVTPCSHMFHDECIVPWVRSNGQCPVCRSIFYERMRASTQLSVGHVQGAPITDTNRILAAELMSIVRAMDGGFEWGHF